MTADSDGLANLTLAESYLGATFEGTIRIYDDSDNFLFQKWFEDVRGGDTYEIKLETSRGFVLATGVIAAFIIIPIVALVWSRRR